MYRGPPPPHFWDPNWDNAASSEVGEGTGNTLSKYGRALSVGAPRAVAPFGWAERLWAGELLFEALSGGAPPTAQADAGLDAKSFKANEKAAPLAFATLVQDPGRIYGCTQAELAKLPPFVFMAPKAKPNKRMPGGIR
jgi:hypothetical protein